MQQAANTVPEEFAAGEIPIRDFLDRLFRPQA